MPDDGAASDLLASWLCSDHVQVEGGPSSGAVVGWTAEDGRPAFVYPEITGYYLTWLAGLASSQPAAKALATERATAAVGWLARVRGGDLPPTRLDLRGRSLPGWRSRALFVFDIAMVVRGLSAVSPLVGAAADDLRARWVLRVSEHLTEHGQLMPLCPEPGVVLPNRWATRPGPHLAKASAALMLSGQLPRRLAAAAETTLSRWTQASPTPLSVDELHPALYQVEALLMTGRAPGRAAEVLRDVLSQMREGRGRRGDVISQALRAAMLLRRHDVATAPSDVVVNRLRFWLGQHITPRGSVLFVEHGERHHNVWATMFAHQALRLHDRSTAGHPIPVIAHTDVV